MCPAEGNTEMSVSCDILSYRKCWQNPAAGPLTCQILALAFLTKFFQWFNEIRSSCIRKLEQYSQCGWRSFSRNFGKALKPLTECLESNLDRPGILWHSDIQFLITHNKNLPNPADLGIIFILSPLLYFYFCWKGTLPGTQFNWYLFSSAIRRCETRQLLFLAYHQLSAGFWMHLNFMHCGFYFCGYIKMFS